jgi:ribosome-binding factor A
MTTFKRADRVADLIKSEISDILLKQIRDPRIGRVTITGAEVTDDLRLARIFFVEMGKDTVDPEIPKGLEKATGFLKRELGKRLRLRFVPDLVFKVDPSFAYGSRIERLLSQIQGDMEENDQKDH